MPFLLYAQHKKLVAGKKSGLVELSRASRFSRSLARLASGKFQLVSSPVYTPVYAKMKFQIFFYNTGNF